MNRTNLKNIKKIFKKDLKASVKNPAVVLAIIVIIILPSLYALLNVQACWDPYGNTDNLNFAIVNNDHNGSYNGQNYSFGGDLVDKLKDNNNFNWTFVDDDEARDGVNNGTYYAAIIIPSNFTKNILSINSQNPTQASMEYLVNDKSSPLASRLSDSAAKSVQSKVNDEVVKTVDMVAFKQLAMSGTSTPSGSLSQVNGTDVSNYFYTPVTLDKTEYYPVDNYGSEVSPFYIVLSIWVGCVIACVLLKTRYLGKNLFNPLEMYFGKMGLFLIVALLQATVTLIGAFHLGIEVSNVSMFIFSVYFISIVFMIIVYSLVSVFGNAGKALAVVILVFQISTTGGIYPVSVMDPIFQMIHPWLPMTYAISMLREATLGMFWANYMHSFIVMLIIPIAVLIISLVIKEKLDKKAQVFENKLIDSGLF